MSDPSRQRRQIVGLDIIRFAAALLVTAFHFESLGLGWVGVQIFFVLSGVVISYSAENSTWNSFVSRRALRLLPCIWICAGLTAVSMVLTGAPVAQKLINTLILWPAGPWVLPVYWTLTVEVAFYACTALAIAAKMRLRFIWLIGAASSVYWIIRFVGIDVPFPGWAARVLLLEHGIYFALGALIQHSMTAPSRAGLFIAAPLMGFAGIEILFAAHAFDKTSIQAVFAYAAFALSVAAMIATTHWKTDRAPAWAPMARTVGLATYPLYLIHLTVAEQVRNPWLGIPLSIAVSLVIARFIEPHIRKALGAVIARPPAVAKP